MAKISLICLPLCFLIFTFFATFSKAGGEGSVTIEECPKECERRCALSKHERCVTYCEMCCEKCLCVPSGTYGHKEECPCYNNWKSRQGKSKCP